MNSEPREPTRILAQFPLLRTTITADSDLTHGANYTSAIWTLLNPGEKDGNGVYCYLFSKALITGWGLRQIVEIR